MKTFRTVQTATRYGVALLSLATVASLIGCGGGDNDDNNRGRSAIANMTDTAGRSVGTASFSQNSPTDPVTIRVQVSGLTPGQHGIHLHQVGRTDTGAVPPFSTAGAHINFSNREHGLQNPNGPHDGDLPNLNVGTDERAIFELTTNRVTLFEGANSLFDADGSSILIHSNPDDQRTNPDGGSGARIVGGVVNRN